MASQQVLVELADDMSPAFKQAVGLSLSTKDDDNSAEEVSAPVAPIAALSARTIETGGEAARRVYQTPELRRRIWLLLGKKTLASLLRVEKAATASVAELLYGEVHTSSMSKMSRANPRRMAYCDAVRVLDRSPRAKLESFRSGNRAYDKAKVPPTRFDPQVLAKNLSSWRKKYPNLQRVLYHYPANEEDDAYVVHLDGETILVELESHVQLDIWEIPFVHPTFPPPPTYKGMAFRHTISLQLVAESVGGLFHSLNDRAGMKAHEDQLKQYLYCNETLDRRVTSIHDISGGGLSLELSYEEAMAFVAGRKARNCEPMANFRWRDASGLNVPNPAALDQLRDISEALGPDLRVLVYRDRHLDEFEMQSVVNAIDAAHPRLHELSLPYYPGDSRYFSGYATPLVGLGSLRKLILDHRFPDDPVKLARWIEGLGGEDCIYENAVFDTVKRMTVFNSIVRNVEKYSGSK